MLSKQKRLNLSTDFKWVSLGKSIQITECRFFGRYGENNIPRVGVAITSKLFPKATLRNKVKRLVFKVFEKVYPELPGNYNIIALPKVGIDKVKSEDLASEFSKAIEKII